MEFVEKVIDWIVWLLIIGSIGAFIWGTFSLVDVFFIRG